MYIFCCDVVPASGLWYARQISPEGAASILGRYKSDAHKAEQFPKDCHALATAQQIYASKF